MSTYDKLGGKTLAELPVPATNLQTTEGTAAITVTWDNNNTLGGSNVIQRWDDATSMWIDSGTYASGATSGVTTGSTPDVGSHNIRVAVLLNNKYYPSLVTTGSIIENPYPLSGLVARWDFDDNLNDSSGNDNNISTYITAVYDTGIVNNGIAVNCHIEETELLSVFDGTNPFTVSLWCNAASGSSNKKLFRINGTNGFYISTYGLQTYAYVDRSANFQTPTEAIQDSNFHNLVLTYDGTNTKYYYDNSLIGTYNESLSITNTSISLEVNAFITDQVYIYNRVLTSTEISKLYNSGAGI